MTSQAKLLDASLDAFRRHAAVHTAAIFTLSANAHDAPALGSGTSIRIGDRLFIATAAHVLEDVPPAHLRVIVQRRNLSTLFVKVIGQGCATSREADVAYLEIEPDAEVEAVTPDRFERAEVLPHDMLTVVAGTPSERLRLSKDVHALAATVFDITFTWNAQPFTFATNPLPAEQWPRDTAVRYQPASHRLLRFEEGEDLDSGAKVGLIKPEGLSGGGIWVVPLRLAEGSAHLWSPTHARLAGIQTGVLRASGILAGCSMGPWIDLMVSRFPELREALAVSP
jgi:hypothetical protein